MTTQPQPSILTSVRALAPRHPVTLPLARDLAEYQAAELLELLGIADEPVPFEALASLPRLDVQYLPNMLSSGVTTWSRGRWRVRLNAKESATRQRFTLAHEIKHIIDAPAEALLYRDLDPDRVRAEQLVEGLCNHFAANLLMPRAAVEHEWEQGLRDLGGLAWRFQVSQQAMLIRLQVLGHFDRSRRWRRALPRGQLATTSYSERSGSPPARQLCSHRLAGRPLPTSSMEHGHGSQ